MSVKLSYEESIISETTVEGPSLLEGEQIELEAKQGISATIKFISVILIFVPPFFFIWSILLLGMSYMFAKKSKIWVTKKRVVYSNWKLRNYSVVSIPLAQIKSASISRNADLLDMLFGLIDRIFGTADVLLNLKGDETTVAKKIQNRLKSRLLPDVKSPKILVQTVNALLSD